MCDHRCRTHFAGFKSSERQAGIRSNARRIFPEVCVPALPGEWLSLAGMYAYGCGVADTSLATTCLLILAAPEIVDPALFKKVCKVRTYVGGIEERELWAWLQTSK